MTASLDLALAVALLGVAAASAFTLAVPTIARRARARDPSHPNVSLVLAPHVLAAAAALVLLTFGASPPFGASRAVTAIATVVVLVAGYVPLALDLARRRRAAPTSDR